MPTTALTAARPTGLLASEFEIEIEIEILAYEQGLVLTPSLQQPESDEIGPRSSDETAYGSDEIGPRSSDETAYGRRHLWQKTLHPIAPRTILCTPAVWRIRYKPTTARPMQSQWLLERVVLNASS